MSSEKRHYELSFNLKVLSEYLSSGKSKYFLNKKYKLPSGIIRRWQKHFLLSSKDLSLPNKVMFQIEFMRKQQQKQQSSSKSQEEELQDEIKRLRQALEFSEMRNEALHEVLKIGREKYGIDLLKKVGAKQ